MERKALRIAAASVAVCMLFLVSSCALGPSETPDVEETTHEQRTYVITTEGHTGNQLLYDVLLWDDNSVCAVAYLGNRSNWKNGREEVYRQSFSDLPEDIFYDLETYDTGGKDVYLFVPRFDQETVNLYAAEVNSDGGAHITELLFSGNEPFYLICDTVGGTSSAKIDVLVPKVLKRSIFPTRDMNDGTVVDADGFQDITPKGLHFDRPHTTAVQESKTD